MDYARLLISKVASTGRIQNLLVDGIREDHFDDEELREIFNFMATHARRYKQNPAFLTVKEQFPYHNFELTDESLDFLQEKFISQVKRARAITAVRDLARTIDDPTEVPNIDYHFLEKSRELAQLVPAAQVSKFSDMHDRISEYESNEDWNQGLRMGIEAIDNITLGIQPHEYVTIMGWTGTGKSTLAQWMLFNFWTQNKKSLMISLEMECRALFRKWDTMATHFEYHNLKSHKLKEHEIKIWKEKADEVKKKPADIIALDNVRGCTVDRVYAEIYRWKPDIVCIDYISLMEAGRGGSRQMWEKLMSLTNELKQVARTTKVPIIGIAQTNRQSAAGGAELDNIAFSMAIIQDSDIVLGLHADDDMKKDHRMELRMLKNRDGMTVNTDLLWEMDTMTFGDWNTHHMFNRHQHLYSELPTEADPDLEYKVEGKI